MDSQSFLGGIWKRGERAGHAPPADAIGEDWGWVGDRAELFLRGAPASSRLFTWDGLALLLRGYARPCGSSGPLDLERVAEELRCHYLEHGELDVDGLDGSFTVALCDSQAERVVLYRNLIGSGFTYYHAGPQGLLFAGNLAELAGLAGRGLAANREALPSFFLFRCVPGRDTLLADFYRLLPGEELTWDRRGLTRRQRHTFASLTTAPVTEADALDRLEAVMSAVLADAHALHPGAANLLSGGVDSSYIQAVWNGAIHPEGRLPASYSVSVDHPHTWPDSDYALSACQMLGTRHKLVPADERYETYLLDALATTAEPLNHVQSAYFGHLARAMRDDGVRAGLCGEGPTAFRTRAGQPGPQRPHHAAAVALQAPARPRRGVRPGRRLGPSGPHLPVRRPADRLGLARPPGQPRRRVRRLARGRGVLRPRLRAPRRRGAAGASRPPRRAARPAGAHARRRLPR
ncbi:MAG: asparagine synthase-related protein [Gemmataceae bacterium]